jgi:hypothetical protein
VSARPIPPHGPPEVICRTPGGSGCMDRIKPAPIKDDPFLTICPKCEYRAELLPIHHGRRFVTCPKCDCLFAVNQPTSVNDDEPLPSPHPVFGKKPGWWARTFGSDEEKYWPTYGDFELFKRHMTRLRAGDYGVNAEGKRLLPCDPRIIGFSFDTNEQSRHRQMVEIVVDEYRKRAAISKREWWEDEDDS